MFKKLRKNEKGFTLAELLIVVAIIGVLVAISIPIFTSQLEKAREATDMANIRSAYAEVVSAELTGESSGDGVTADGDHWKKTVTLTQQKDGWQSDVNKPENLADGTTQPTAGQTVTIESTDTGASINIAMAKATT